MLAAAVCAVAAEADMLRGMRDQYRCCVATLADGAAAQLGTWDHLWGTFTIWIGEARAGDTVAGRTAWGWLACCLQRSQAVHCDASVGCPCSVNTRCMCLTHAIALCD